MSRPDSAIEARIAAIEPSTPRPLATLIDRFGSLDEGLRGARSDGRAIGPAALGSIEIAGLSYDSRRVAPGGIFVAIPGEHADGHDHVTEAVRRGAVVAIVERPLPDQSVPQLIVGRSRRALA